MGLVLAFLISLISIFLFSLISNHFLIDFLSKAKVYKKSESKETVYGEEAVEFNAIRSKNADLTKQVPRMGGFLILLPLIVFGTLFAFIFNLINFQLFLFLFYLGFIVGMVDDLADIKFFKGNFSFPKRIIFVSFIAIFLAVVLSFFTPMILSTPFGYFYLGAWFIPFVWFWFLLWYGGSVIDGIDGLSASQFVLMFSALSIIALIQGNFAVFLASILLTIILLAYLCFNIQPAKIYLTESGTMPILFSFAFLSLVLGFSGEGNGIWLSILIGMSLILTWGSVVLQLLYRKKFKKKLFKIAPVHHHFEAMGIPSSSVVLYYFVFTFLMSIIAIFLALSFV